MIKRITSWLGLTTMVIAVVGGIFWSKSSLVLAQAPVQPNFGQTVGPGSTFNLQIESYLFSGPVLATANLTGCVTGGSPSLVGNQTFFKVTGGTTAQTTCTVTWASARSVAPTCLIVGETVGLPAITVNSTTVLTWTFASTASTVWDIACFGAR